MAKGIGKSLITLAFVLFIGTAGSDDQQRITFEQVIVQCIISLLVAVIGFGIMYVAERRELRETGNLQARRNAVRDHGRKLQGTNSKRKSS